MKLGAAGEKIAARALRRDGYRITARNYACPVGEIDLVALDGDTIVFVEVKTRRSGQSADPEANVHREKRRRLTRAAKYYLMQKKVQGQPCRFDVVSVVTDPGSDRPEVEHFVDAFGPTPR